MRRVGLPFRFFAVCAWLAPCFGAMSGCDADFRFDERSAGLAGAFTGNAGRGGAGNNAGAAGTRAGNGGAAGTRTGTGGRLGCTDDESCGQPGLHCDQLHNRCVACLRHADCSKPTPRCDPATYRCVACETAQDCEEGKRCVGKRCVTPCDANSVSDCRSPEEPYCLSQEHCAECLKSAHCGPGMKCDLNTGRCVECIYEGDCADQRRGYCDRFAGKCVECLWSDHCPSVRPYCSQLDMSCFARP